MDFRSFLSFSITAMEELRDCRSDSLELSAAARVWLSFLSSIGRGRWRRVRLPWISFWSISSALAWRFTISRSFAQFVASSSLILVFSLSSFLFLVESFIHFSLSLIFSASSFLFVSFNSI